MSVYGLVLDPAQVERQVDALLTVLPPESTQMICRANCTSWSPRRAVRSGISAVAGLAVRALERVARHERS